jgi:chorismate synthase
MRNERKFLMPLRFLTAGESHGPSLTTILDGIPAGLPLSPDIINKELARRQQIPCKSLAA